MENNCSECDLMVILRWGLGIQILLVSAVQTSDFYKHIHTQKCGGKKLNSQATGVSTQNSIYKQKSIFIFIQQHRIMDVTVIVAIKIYLWCF